MIKRTYLFICLIILNVGVKAQNARTSLDFTVGPTFALTSIPSGLSGGGGLGIKYNLTKTVAFGLSLDFGNLRGSQDVPYITGPSLPKVFNAYSNNFALYNANIQINLNNMLHLRSIMKRVNPYLVFGAGINNSDVKAYLVDGRVKHFVMNFNNASAGIVVRYFYNPQYDLKFGVNFNYTQSHYLDGIPSDGKDDYFVMSSIGVAYKIGASRSNPHIEWEDVIAEYKEPVRKIKLPKEPRERKKKEYGKEILAYVKSVFTKDTAESKVTNNALLAEQSKSDSTIGVVKDNAIVNKPENQNNDIAKVDSATAIGLTDTSHYDALDTTHSVTVGISEEGAPTQKQDQSFRVPTTEVLTGVLPMNSANTANKPKVNFKANGQPIVDSNAPISSGTKLATAPRQTYKPSTGILAPELIEEVSEVKSPIKKSTSKKLENPNINGQPIASAYNKTKAAPIEQGISDTNAPFVTPVIPAHQIIEPIATYNVIVGSYISKKYAIRFNNKLRKLGYESLIFKSSPHSRLLRVSVYSGHQKHDAIVKMMVARKQIDKGAWIHVYRPRN